MVYSRGEILEMGLVGLLMLLLGGQSVYALIDPNNPRRYVLEL